MSTLFRYRSHQIRDIVDARKVVREGESLEFRKFKEHSRTLMLNIDLAEGALINLRLIVTAGRPDEPESYHAALLLDEQRIRGVDYCELPRRRFYKTVIPQGWHENLVDPNLTGEDNNRHISLAEFEITDLTDFLHKVSGLWHIELPEEATLL